MEQSALFVALAIGALFGGVVSWLVFRGDARHAFTQARAENESERAQLIERVVSRDEQIAALKAERAARVAELQAEIEERGLLVVQLQEGNSRLNAEKAEVEARAAAVSQATEEKLALLRQTQEEMKTGFQALTGEALKSNNQAFLELAQATMAPVRESLGKFDEQMREVEKAREGAYAGLSKQVEALLNEQSRLRAETGNLVKALRAPQVRGRWGEIQLRRVVEMAGMVNYCDFSEQEPLEGEEGLFRPDMIVKLPNDRQIVVDSKVSLSAYLEALDAPDEDTRTQKLKDHAGQVRTHLMRLGGKKYWSRLPQTPEFVVAFLPGETFFSAALDQDPGLIEFGVDQKVILATPTTLIALLKSVAYGWQQKTLAASAEAISRLGRELFERLGVFRNHFQKVGEGLDRAVRCYNDAAGSLEARVLVSARRFEELGGPAAADLKVAEPVAATVRELAPAENGEQVQTATGGE
ncbi:MAG: DNA recombination protein RmuC [Acidobacteria bacterium]|nr:DNA recombination protein RmuC [Acidobacteriota bacterium]